MDVKNSILKKNSFFLIITLLVIGIWLFLPKKALNIKVLQKVTIGNDHFVIYVVDRKYKEVKIDEKAVYDQWVERKRNEKYFFRLLSKPQPVIEDEIDDEKLNLLFKQDKLQNLDEDKLKAKKIEIMYAFWTIPAGTNCEYITDKEFLNEINNCLTLNDDGKNPITKITLSKESQKNFNNISNDSLSSVKLQLSNSSSKTTTINTCITNSSLPIQWPSRLDWSLFGYLWNVLIISISFLLYFFSTFLTNIGDGGLFFGNLGLGIVLTTIVIRTLTWPIYTKTSTFSMNMNLLQPEIEKVKQKYTLKKDPASAQKMQLEILKVYRKNNFSFWGFLVSFLQLPLFIAINQTLRRFLIQGGIFKTTALIDKRFLGFISLDPNKSNNIFIVILLSFLVGTTMFILNKISFKKPEYLKTSTHHLTLEQKIKTKQSEKTMKITSWIMILMMVFFSRSNTVLSLYWIVGNTYTIFQTLITQKKIGKKYWELKNKTI
ncbi:membrane protein insertase YidC ['Fragaria x ananassa' phyllody phytoplasma]|uniref:Membrane protein insertase YidC n=1 Tax='Fragaria x ananassa' phyllody phytoplasma TaxID=2358428 RepID=A0ABS5K3A2_9MOLU|nr:membrane protein insertase YidC ['Fragaria x ananassa' phyllody phytoplasma]MBS2126348.1 membrane protein insertase YidC ['Fragaria x ananassa' phyllody phytoplasma]